MALLAQLATPEVNRLQLAPEGLLRPMVSAVTATVGHKVKKGEKIIILEAMKMQTTVYALTDGIIDQVEVQAGDQVESKDLLVKLR